MPFPDPDPRELEAFIQAQGAVESGGSYTAENPTSSASGKYQYIKSTWNNYGGYAEAYLAPPDVQERRYREDVIGRWHSYGDWAKVAAAHFYPAWVNDPSKWNTPVAGNGNVTLASYSQNVVGRMGGFLQDPNWTPPTVPGIDTTSLQAAGLPPDEQAAVDAFLRAINENPDALVQARFPTYAMYLSDPEIGPILREAALNNWDPLRLQNALQSTAWWSRTSDAQRAWDYIVSTDPATAASQRAAMANTIGDEFTRIGFAATGDQVSRIAEDALRLGWNPAQIADGVRAGLPAGWWESTSQAQRDWQALLIDDPATAQTQREAAQNLVREQFERLGFAATGSQIATIAENALRFGWTQDQITDSILGELPGQFTEGALGVGDVDGLMRQLKTEATRYYMPLSDTTAYDWARRILDGSMTQAAATSEMQRWAKTSYTWMGDQIDQGFTPSDYFRPFQEEIGNIMGTSPTEIDFLNDPYWRQLVALPDSTTGQVRAPTIMDAQRLAFANPAYSGTQHAINRAADFVMTARRTFEGS